MGPLQCRRHLTVRDLAIAEQQLLDDESLVDGVGHSLPDLKVIEGRLVSAEEEPLRGDDVKDLHLQALILLEPVDELIGRTTDHTGKGEIVYITLFQGGKGYGGIRDHLHND